MGRLLVLVLLVVAAVVAYPWVGVVLGLVVILAASVRARKRRPTVRRGGGAGVSLERRVALRRAREELRSIEGGAGLPPSV